MKILLGVDFGLRRIGLAIAETGLVRPLAVVSNSPRVIEEIKKICQQNQIEKIVIGLPEDKLAGRTREFAVRLSLVTHLPIEFQDETLTTQQAIAKMITAGKKKKIRQEEKDAFAAACLLQEYLEERREGV